MFSFGLCVSAFLLWICCFCVLAHTRETNGFDLFVPNETCLWEKKQFLSYGSPSLFELDGLLVALVEADTCQIDDEQNNIYIVGKYVELMGAQSKTDVVNGGGDIWNTELVVTNTTSYPRIVAQGPTTIVRGDKVFLYCLVFFLKAEGSSTESTLWEMDFQLRVGSVNRSADGSKKLHWGEPTSLKDMFNGTPEKVEAKNIIGGSGSGVAMRDKTLVFPVTYEESNYDTDRFSTVIHSKDSEGTKWEFVPSTLPKNCINPAVVEWERKLVMMVLCRDGIYRVFESTNMGAKWTEAVGSLSGVWGSTRDRQASPTSFVQNGFITAEIEGRKMMLFAGFVETEDHKYQPHLWMSDNKRIYDVGPISNEKGDDRAPSTLLYSKDRLFLLHEKPATVSENNVKGLYFTSLTSVLERIKAVRKKWDAQDKLVANTCAFFGKHDGRFSNVECPINMITNGLVGFLSNNGVNTTWFDEYLCVNATARGRGGKVKNGLQFIGPGSGARWPVGEQGQNQRYHFANNGFTLMATVTVNSAPVRKHNSLLGLVLAGDNKNKTFGLLCSGDSRWTVQGAEGSPRVVGKGMCRQNNAYRVVLVSRNGRGYVYVEGEVINEGGDAIMANKESDAISYFFFGADSSVKGAGQHDSGVTVTNVALYNRPFTAEEIVVLRNNELAHLNLQPGKINSNASDKNDEAFFFRNTQSLQGNGAANACEGVLLSLLFCVCSVLLELSVSPFI